MRLDGIILYSVRGGEGRGGEARRGEARRGIFFSFKTKNEYQTLFQFSSVTLIINSCVSQFNLHSYVPLPPTENEARIRPQHILFPSFPQEKK